MKHLLNVQILHNIDIATSDDWDCDWLIERGKTVIVFPESDLEEQLIEQLVKMFSKPGEAVIFP